MFFRTRPRAGQALPGLWRPTVLVTWLLAAATAQAAPAPASEAALERSTTALAALASRYAAGDGQAPAIAAQMAQLAAERQQQFLRLVEQDPSAALRYSLPARVRERMPDAVQAHVEERRELTGELAVRYEHWEDRSELVHELVTGPERLRLYFAGDAPRAMSGTPVRARGVALGDAMAVSPDDSGLVVMNLDSSGSGGTTTATSLADTHNTMGEQRTLVLLVNWLDKPDQPYTLEEVHSLVFGDLSNYLLEASYGQTWLSGKVHGWYTMPSYQPRESATCLATEVAQAAKDLASADGVDVSAFGRIIYVFPQTSCFATGLATLGGNPSEAWINGVGFELKVVGHEVGHNFGLYHSAALDCETEVIADNCRYSPYGDTMDIMGNKVHGHFNAFQKERLGWLSAAGEIVEATGSGVFRLGVYEDGSFASPKAIKVLRNTGSVAVGDEWFYIEHRQAIGFDGTLAGNENVLNGLVVRHGMESDPGSSLMLDMTPGSDFFDMYDPALVFGETFVDPGSGASLTGSKDEAGAVTVHVGLGSPQCVASSPGLVISPTEGQWAEPGAPATFMVTISNQDSGACSAAVFRLEAALPGGWQGGFDTPTLTLNPGAAATIAFTVESAMDAQDGVFGIGIIASRDDGLVDPASSSATYVVSSIAENAPPVAVDDSAETAPGTPVTIEVLRNDYDPDGDALAVTAVYAGSKGSVEFTAEGFVVYTPGNGAKGQDRFSYTISDGLSHSSAEVAISVKGKGAGGSGGGGNGKGKNR